MTYYISQVGELYKKSPLSVLLLQNSQHTSELASEMINVVLE